LVIGILAAVLFSLGEYLYSIIGVIALHVSFLFDCVDGRVAKIKSMTSNYGHWIDDTSDKIIDFLVIFSILFALYNQTKIVEIWIVGLIAISFNFLIQLANFTTDIVMGLDRNKKVKILNEMGFLRNFAYTSLNLYVLISLGIVLNQVYLFFLIIDIYIISCYLVFIFYINKKFKTKQRV